MAHKISLKIIYNFIFFRLIFSYMYKKVCVSYCYQNHKSVVIQNNKTNTFLTNIIFL